MKVEAGLAEGMGLSFHILMMLFFLGLATGAGSEDDDEDVEGGDDDNVFSFSAARMLEVLDPTLLIALKYSSFLGLLYPGVLHELLS